MIRFNPDVDIPRAEQDRRERVANGQEPTRDEIRAKGGVVLSDRAAVLLEHYIAANMQLRDQVEQAHNALKTRAAAAEAQTCARRLVEYVGALEDVVLQPFSDAQWDTPLSTVGLAAAALERLADTMMSAPDPSQETIAGIESFRDVAHRLRQIEYRMQQIPGVTQDIEPAALPLPGSLALRIQS